MPIIIDEFGQDDERWKAAKLGIPSSSRFSDIITTKGVESKSRDKYLFELSNQVITQRYERQFQLSAFKRGKEMEPESRLYAENVLGIDIRQVALVYKNERKRYLCSPDGLIDDNGGFETKDANVRIQRERLKQNRLPPIHFAQVMGSLYITEREYWIYQSYCTGMRTLTLKIYRDEKFIKQLALELKLFCEDLEKEVFELRNA